VATTTACGETALASARACTADGQQRGTERDPCPSAGIREVETVLRRRRDDVLCRFR